MKHVIPSRHRAPVRRRILRAAAVALVVALQAIPAFAVNDPQCTTSPVNGAAKNSSGVPFVKVACDRDLGGGSTIQVTDALGSVVAGAQTMDDVNAVSGRPRSIKFTASETLTDDGSPYRVTYSAAPDPTGDAVASSFSFAIDNVAPGAPAISAPAEGATLNASAAPSGRATVSGTAEGAAVVTVKEGLATLGTATADAAGHWSLTTTTLSDGAHSISAVAADAASNASASSASRGFSVDAGAPGAPVVVSPAANAALNSSTVTVTGTAEAASNVTVIDGTDVLATVGANNLGNWSLAQTFADGTHSLTAKATDAAGNVSASSSARNFSVDTGVPATPVITSPANGATLNNGTIAVTGNAESGSTVTLIEGATTVGAAIANATGAWTVSRTFGDGAHSVSATATDAAGNTSPTSAARSFTVDTAAPAAPVILSPANGARVSSPTTVSGTAEAGTTVVLTEIVSGPLGSRTTVGTTVVDASGNWSILHTFADGNRTVGAQATDVAGNTGSASSNRSFVVDSIAPGVPVITAPAQGAQSNVSSVTMSGTAENNATVTVYEGSTIVATVAADGSGMWTSAHTFADGSHTIVATGTDAAGNVSPGSAGRAFTIDTHAPGAPIITSPASGSLFNSRSVTFAGTAEASSTLAIFEGATQVGTTNANGTGAWSFSRTFASDGNRSITATATDAAGNASPVSAPVTIAIDTIAPSAPSISTPAANATVGSSTPIAGTAEANSHVRVVQGASVKGEVDADASGNWSVSASFADGSHTITATATDAASNTSVASAGRTFTVDSVPPSLVSSTPADHVVAPASSINATYSEPLSSVSIVVRNRVGTLVSGSTAFGSGSTNATFTPTGGAFQPAGAPYTWTTSAQDLAGSSSVASTRQFSVGSSASIGSPAESATLSAGPVTVSGTGNSGLTIDVREGAASVGSATVALDGTWSTSITFADGAHSITAVQRDARCSAGACVADASAARGFAVDGIAPSAPVIVHPTSGALLNTSSVSVGGTGEPNTHITVIEGSATVGSATVDASGDWSFVVTFADGAHAITATASDAAGNSSAATSRSFRVDATAPSTPVITGPAAGASLKDASVTVTGTAEASSTITISEGATSLGNASTDAGGDWSFPHAFSDGAHSISVVAADAAGNTSAAAVRSFAVDTAAPSAPVISQPGANAALNTASVTVSGSAEPGSVVGVSEGGTTLGSPTTDVNGAWSLTKTFTEGSHAIDATAHDAAGNVSAVTSRSFTIDTVAPVAPVIGTPAADAILRDPHVAISGTAETGTTVMLAEGSTAIGNATADGTGAWSLVTTFTEGAHALGATSADAAGNASPATFVTFTVDSQAPAAPVVSSPSEGATVSGPVTVGGTAEANSHVVVNEGVVTLASTTADASGNWSFARTFSDGPHSISVTATDAAGNASAPAARTFSVRTPSGTPTIVQPSENAVLASGAVTLAGTGDPNATVMLSEGVVKIGSAKADASGTWSFAGFFQDGAHTVTVVVTDPAGNVVSGSSSGTFTIDTHAPAAPAIQSPASDSLVAARVLAKGVAEAMSTVRVYESATMIGSTTTSSDGAWSLAVTFGDGTHTITAAATDRAGNASIFSTPVSFTVDANAPVVTFTTPNNSIFQPGQSATMDGTGRDDRAIVSVTLQYFDLIGRVALTKVAGLSPEHGPQVDWSSPADELLPGYYTVKVTGQDQVGNRSQTVSITFLKLG